MLMYVHACVNVLSGATIKTSPENTTVCRGSNVTISCGHVISRPKPVTWIINGTSFSQEQILFSPLYRQNRQGTPTENSLTVFSINDTTTFQCVVQSTPAAISTCGTVTVNGTYVSTYVHIITYTYTTCGAYVCTYIMSKFFGPQLVVDHNRHQFNSVQIRINMRNCVYSYLNSFLL